KTCANYPAGTCGQQSDGCGGLTANCGGCNPPQYCGGGGVGECGGSQRVLGAGGVATQCKPATCASLGYSCGMAGDGCGGTIGPRGPACGAPPPRGARGTPHQ